MIPASSINDLASHAPIGAVLPYFGGGAQKFGGATPPPAGWLYLNGGGARIADHPGLYHFVQSEGLIGPGKPFDYGPLGSQGITTFFLPDLRGRVVAGYDAAETEFDHIGEIGGEKTHLLSAAESGEMGHNHTQNAHLHYPPVAVVNGGNPGVQRALLTTNSPFWGNATPPNGDTNNPMSPTAATNQAVAASAASSAHNNLQPYFSLNWIIRAD
jgi:microcystin-dependent protein